MIVLDVSDTIVAVSSPPGAAARGIVRLSGSKAVDLAATVFQPDAATRLAECSGRQIVEGTVSSGGSPLPAHAYLFRAPRSYTGQDVVELHVLGAPGVLALVVEALLAAGARRAEPGEFTARAFLAGRMDLSQVHGVAAMIAARSDRQLQAAQRLLDGDLASTAREAREALADLLALIEGALDFADEPIEFISPRQLRERLRDVAQSLRRAVDAGSRSERWRSVPNILLWGPPNVGKSSLLNRLTDSDRAISSPVAGTTRDVIAAPIRLGGIECLLCDVAGADRADDELNASAQSAARRAWEAADVVLLVQDGPESSVESPPVDPDVPVFRVVNKIDLYPATAPVVGDEGVFPVSARTGTGCGQLLAAVEHELSDRGYDRREPMLAMLSEHRASLSRAMDAIERAVSIADQSPNGSPALSDADLVALELHAAASELGILVGEDLPDDLLGRIFSRFCIGK